MKPILLLLLILAAMLPGACKSLPGDDGRYATFDRGRSNNRAEVPAPPETALPCDQHDLADIQLPSW